MYIRDSLYNTLFCFGARWSPRSEGELKAAPLPGASTPAEMEKLLSDELRYKRFKPDQFGFERQSKGNHKSEKR